MSWDVPALLATLVSLTAVNVAVAMWLRRSLREQAANDLELAGLLRPVMQDLAARDPQLAEPIELALTQLDDMERAATAALRWTRARPHGSRRRRRPEDSHQDLVGADSRRWLGHGSDRPLLRLYLVSHRRRRHPHQPQKSDPAGIGSRR